MKKKPNNSRPGRFRFLLIRFGMIASLIVMQLILSTGLSAQTTTIRGAVSDSSGPLANVTVTVQGSSTGVNTDGQGRFSIQALRECPHSFYIGWV